MILFIKLLSVTGISLLLCYLVGIAIVRLFRLNPRGRFFALFISLVTGLSSIVSLYALICTRGNTIQAAILILSFVVVWALRSSPAVTSPMSSAPIVASRTGASALPILLFLTIFAFCSQYFVLYDSSSEYLQTPFVDYVYYSRLSLPLNNLGLETNSLEVVYTQFLTQQPYHYFEIWLNAALVRITGLPSAWMFFISSASILLTIMLVGFSAVFAHFQLKSVWVVILALLFLFVTGIRWPFLQQYSFVANGALFSTNLLCFHPKLVPVYIFTLLAGLLLLNRCHIAAGAALAILPLSFISTAPVAGIGMVALSGYLLLTKQLPWSKAVAMVLPVVLSTLYIVLFYALRTKPYQFPTTDSALTLQSIIPHVDGFKTLFNIMAGILINYAIHFAAYGALALVILLLRRQPTLLSKAPAVIWIWFGTSLIVSTIMLAFGTHYLDSFQFFSNAMLPITSVVLAIVLAVILQGASKRIYFLTTGFFLLMITINFYVIGSGATRYSPQFLKQVSKVIPQIGRRGAYILADADYKSAYSLSSDSYTAGGYISNFKNDYALVSLTAIDNSNLSIDERFKRDSAQAEQIIRKSSIYRFAKFQSMNQKKLSLDSIKYKFVIQNNIGFICASREAKLPTLLQPLVSARYTDELSGERLYLLNPSKGVAATNAYK